MDDKISIVIPCYRSEKTLPYVMENIKKTISPHNMFQYEVILVNDASPDDLSKVIEEMIEQNNTNIDIKYIEMAKNFGQHAALLAGYREATGNVVVSCDDDGETPTDRIFDLVSKIEEGYDVVYASYNNLVRGKFRAFGTRINNIMATLLIGKPSKLRITSFFAAKKFVIDQIVNYSAPYPYVAGLILQTTDKICNVQMEQRSRLAGKSGYSIKKLFLLWLNGFTAFSVKPLRIASFFGIVCTILGMLAGLYVVIQRLINPSIVAGYSSLMASILFVGGIIMLLLGMVGEYVGRIYISLNSSPQYVIRRTINIEGNRQQTESTKESDHCE